MTTTNGERADLLESLRAARFFLRNTVDGLSDDQARERTTISELTLGGLVKHVSATEAQWARFVVEGTSAMEIAEDVDPSEREREFTLLPDETLADVLAAYERVADATDDLVGTVDLDLSHPLPATPWFEPGATRSARRVFTHLVAETAQHAGHADIVREALDGRKSMG